MDSKSLQKFLTNQYQIAVTIFDGFLLLILKSISVKIIHPSGKISERAKKNIYITLLLRIVLNLL